MLDLVKFLAGGLITVLTLSHVLETIKVKRHFAIAVLLVLGLFLFISTMVTAVLLDTPVSCN